MPCPSRSPSRCSKQRGCLMDTTPRQPPPAPAVAQSTEQLRYAKLLEWGTRIGLLVLVLSFAAYLSGWLAPRLSVRELAALWHLPASEFTQRTGMPQGWGWLAHLHQGDLAGLLGIALLAACSMPCLLALVPLYLRRGDRAYAAICLAEVAVLLLAASGLMRAGH